MSGGLFSVICVQCGADIPVNAAGAGYCNTCARLYLHRFGYLIPLDTAAGDPPSMGAAPPAER